MADFLKVSTPTSGYENSTRTNPISINDKAIQNVVDPTKVVRPDGQSKNMEDGFLLHYESNYEKFQAMLREAPNLSETLKQLLFLEMSTVVSSGLKTDFAKELAQFMEMLKMTEGELLQFLKSQGHNASKFHGTFFDALRQAMENTTSVELKTSILQFAKKYNDIASSKTVFQTISTLLENISDKMFSNSRDTLLGMMGKLQPNTGLGSNPANVALLKNEIIPFLSKYISRTHDLGLIRDQITQLTLNLARYENGTKEDFLTEFGFLLGFREVGERLGGIGGNDLEALLKTILQKPEDPIMAQLINVIERGLLGEAGQESKSVFQNIMQSILVNESVYMPLLHMVVPAEVNGKLMFSELWVDPENKSGVASGEDSVRMLIKFDIKDLGFFDLILTTRDKSLDMQLYYPDRLSPMEGVIKKGIQGIVEKNGMYFRNFFMERSFRPKTITEVFPKIYERKNAINVKV